MRAPFLLALFQNDFLIHTFSLIPDIWNLKEWISMIVNGLTGLVQPMNLIVALALLVAARIIYRSGRAAQRDANRLIVASIGKGIFVAF